MNWYVGAVLVLLAALVLDMGLLAYSMYALLAVMIVSRLAARTWAESLSAARECHRVTANVGDVVAVQVRVKNEGRLPIAWALLDDLLPRHALIHRPPSLKVEGSRTQLAMFGPGATRLLLYQLKCNRRGYYQIGPLVMETGDLFGLHRRYRVLSHPHFLLVYPEVRPLEGYDIASRRPVGEVRMTHRLFEDPTRIAGVREYQAGDPLNRVHWKATARTGQLHSKIYEPSTIVGATLVLDFHTASYPRANEPYRSELAVTATASLANAIYEMNQQVGLVTNARDAADRIRQEGWDFDIRSRQAARRLAEMADQSDRLTPLIVDTRRGVDQLMRILETLARAELTDGLTLPQLLHETQSHLPRDATVIVMLPQVTHETAVALGNLRRSGYAVSAIVNLYDTFEFSQAADMLLAEGVEARQLRSEEEIVSMCRSCVTGRSVSA